MKPHFSDSIRHTRFQQLKRNLGDILSIAVDKTVAHLADPDKFPKPAAGRTVERALYDVLQELPRKKREDFIDKYKAIATAGSGLRKERYGVFEAIDLRSTVSVEQQLKTLQIPDELKLSTKDFEEIASQLEPHRRPKASSKRVPRQAVVATTLEFIVESLTCDKKTDFLKDEINMAGFAVDFAGTPQEKDPFFVSKFKNGQTVPLGDKGRLFSFSIDGGSTGINFPAVFSAGIFLTESELFANRKLGRAIGILLSIIGGLGVLAITVLSIVFLPPIGWTIAGIVVSAAIYIFGNDYILLSGIDELGEPVTDELTLDQPPAPGEIISKRIDLILSGRPGFITGKYHAQVKWVAS